MIPLNTTTSTLAIYSFLFLNFFTFLVYGIDKHKARHAKWRVSEKSLLLLAIAGGSIGAWCGMKIWHHKTLHKKFTYGVPLIIFIQLLAATIIWEYYP